MKTCSIDGCDNPVLAKNLCRKHYKRLARHGEPTKEPKAAILICTIEGCGKKHLSGGYCAMHYKRFHRYGDPNYIQPNKLDVFIQTVIETDTDECIVWPFGSDDRRYPGSNAIRRILELKHGPPPQPEMCACHMPIVCHNPKCVNWKHLRWDTQQANIHDKIQDKTIKLGEDHPHTKITEEDVRFIRASSLSQAELGAMFNMTQAGISNIVRRKTWRHVS